MFWAIATSPLWKYIRNTGCRLYIGGQYNLDKRILQDILNGICPVKIKIGWALSSINWSTSKLLFFKALKLIQQSKEKLINYY